MRNLLVMISLLALSPSCALEPQLLPDKGSRPDAPAGSASALGVVLRVDGDAWRGAPDRLPEVVTPVKVTVENTSGRPVRLAYEDFSLDGKKHYPALPLLARDVAPRAAGRNAPALLRVASGPEAPPRPAPRFPSRGFFVAEFYKQQYPNHEPWPRHLEGESPSRAIANSLLAANLPSADMMADGLPEGVLESGGFVTGYLFFERVEPRETKVNFNLELSDPDTREQFGQLTIPLAVKF